MTILFPAKPTTARGRARRWCLDNPGEVLTFSDIQQKFGVTPRNAEAIIHHLRREGLLVSEPVYMVRSTELKAAA